MFKDRGFAVLMLSVLLTALVGFSRPIPMDQLHQIQRIEERFWVVKTQSKTQFDMMLMGDSRVYRGLSPEAMREVLPNYRILNFGYSGGGYNSLIYQEVESRLDPSSAKKIIVLGITPYSLTPAAAKNQHFLQEKNRNADYVFLRLYAFPLVEFFHPIMPSDIVNAMLMSDRGDKSYGYYQEFYDDGWVASWSIPEYPSMQLGGYQNLFSTTSVDAKIVRNLMDQTSIWGKRGIAVFAFRMPTTQDMVALENELSGFDENLFKEQFQESGGIWLDIPLEPYRSYDGSHLVKESAILLSKNLAQLIKNHLESP